MDGKIKGIDDKWKNAAKNLFYFPWEKTPGYLSRSTFIKYNVVQELIYFTIFKWNKQTISKKMQSC